MHARVSVFAHASLFQTFNAGVTRDFGAQSHVLLVEPLPTPLDHDSKVKKQCAYNPPDTPNPESAESLPLDQDPGKGLGGCSCKHHHGQVQSKLHSIAPHPRLVLTDTVSNCHFLSCPFYCSYSSFLVMHFLLFLFVISCHALSIVPNLSFLVMHFLLILPRSPFFLCIVLVTLPLATDSTTRRISRHARRPRSSSTEGRMNSSQFRTQGSPTSVGFGVNSGTAINQPCDLQMRKGFRPTCDCI